MMPPPTTPTASVMLLLVPDMSTDVHGRRAARCMVTRGHAGSGDVPLSRNSARRGQGRLTMHPGGGHRPHAPVPTARLRCLALEEQMISGKTTLVAHLGYPTFAFKAPLIYNPWFEKSDIDAVVVPMGVKAEEYPEFFRYLFKLTNIRGALVTMPHKVTTMDLVDEVSPTAAIAGAANAVLL